MIVAVVVLMVAPVATGVLEVLVAASLGLAGVMVMAALYVRAPMRLATWPRAPGRSGNHLRNTNATTHKHATKAL